MSDKARAVVSMFNEGVADAVAEHVREGRLVYTDGELAVGAETSEPLGPTP